MSILYPKFQIISTRHTCRRAYLKRQNNSTFIGEHISRDEREQRKEFMIFQA